MRNHTLRSTSCSLYSEPLVRLVVNTKGLLLLRLLVLALCLPALSLFAACQANGVGGPCQEDGDCSLGLFCDRGAPGGYCSMECETNLPCPARIVCAALETKAPDSSIVTIRRCLLPCGVPQDCRDGYTCRLLASGQERVCFPKTSSLSPKYERSLSGYGSFA